jgi:hypothetical protein
METPEILTKAAEVIETRGWHQGDFVPPNTDPETAPVCVMAAINVAAGMRPNGYRSGAMPADDVDALYAARRALGARVADDIVAWNDQEGRTRDEVTTALRECAANLKASA